jgi:UDP-glucose 4-epimerase
VGNSVFTAWCCCASSTRGLLGRPLTVFGSGEQRRCFADVGEVVSCLWRLAGEPSAVGRVSNVGSDEETPIAALAERVRARTGRRSEIVRRSYQEAYGPGFEDLGCRVPDLCRLEGAIGTRPRRPLADLLDDVIADRARALAGR